jgi:uncharacterized protein YecT (DUF1311 family)
MNKVPQAVAVVMLVAANDAAWSQAPECNEDGTQIELTACAVRDFNTADAELNRVYKKLMDSLTTENQKRLRNEQRGWLKERDPKCKKETNAEAYGGSIWPMLYERCREKLTKDRTQQLRNWNGN